MRGISDEACDAAVEYLNDYADAAGQAHADRQLAEYYRKAKRAELILKAPERTQGLKEAWAECHTDYLETCRKEAEAIKQVEWHRHNLARAKAVLDVWRSVNARERELSRIR
jgi:hypothetical protein